MTPEEMLREFHAAAGDEIGRGDNEGLRLKLIEEEFHETANELGFDEDYDWHWFPKKDFTVDKAKLAKELADLVVVVYGTADAFDIPLEKVLAEVHRSNMTKFPECASCGGKGKFHGPECDVRIAFADWLECKECNGTGRIKIARADGKILKPDTYEEADVERILNDD